MALWSRREHKTRILLDILLRAQVSQRGTGCQTQLLWCWCSCTPLHEIDLHSWYLLPKDNKKIRLVKVQSSVKVEFLLVKVRLSQQMICSTTQVKVVSEPERIGVFLTRSCVQATNISCWTVYESTLVSLVRYH